MVKVPPPTVESNVIPKFGVAIETNEPNNNYKIV
jgi:hypothetical protein